MNWNAADPPYPAEVVEEIFSAASELPRDAQAALLTERCEGKPGLWRAVEELLESSQRAESAGLWSEPALMHAAREEARDPRLPFTQLGPYRVISRIGMGGMGAVYLAGREYDGIHRRVAIKLVPRVATSSEALALFEQERRILARLEHPNIALMLDAGRTPDGFPYLAMQYVEGQPLDRYAAEKNLRVAERLELLRAVAGAVAYAHSRGVLHRDLKPRNILVTGPAGGHPGVPKVLDFGIAKLLDEAQAGGPSAGLMTPGYASPEQIAGFPLTPASDIYSLGVLLFELLTGARPVPGDVTGPSFVARRGKLGPGAPPDAARALGRRLDRIVAKALRRLPEERYRTAAEFQEAMGAFLESHRGRTRRR
jgi:serine/threonine protein kinase